MFKKIFLILVLGLSFLPSSAQVFAEGETPPEIGIESDFLPGTSEEDAYLTAEEKKEQLQSETIGNAVRLLTSIVSGMAVLIIVIAGYTYLTARGNEEKIRQAHRTVAMAIIGLFVMLFAYSAVSIIANLTSLL